MVASETAEPIEKTVTLCIRSRLIYLNGTWNWDVQSHAVYCSDVMFFPEEFEGTKGIIHPDDLPKLLGAITLLEDKETLKLEFRIITTYGEVKTISGERISIEERREQTTEPLPGKEPWEEVLHQVALKKENDFLQLRRELSDHTERLHGIGSWLIQKQSGQAWYSDNVFRIYGLAPQSLNAHANSFNHFIHKEDRMAVQDAFEKAFEEQVPLHIEYRIVLPDGKTRYVQQITKWLYSANGQPLCSGIVRDVTGERAVADELLAEQSNALQYQQVVKLSGQQTLTGYWIMNLVTRKTTYSENYYRIYGLRQTSFHNHNAFLNLVHADDRESLQQLTQKMYKEHSLPETEFRIIRPDGKLRYLKQSGKLFISPGKELIMIGLVQDITVLKGLEKKVLELNERISLNKVVVETMENTTSAGCFLWLPDGTMQWSDGFYQLLGHRPGSVEPLPRFVYKSIHPADLKTFKDAEVLVLNHQNHDDIVIRIVSKNGMRWVKISFRQINSGKDTVLALVRDISAQMALQETFNNNRNFSRVLEEAVTDMIIVTNTDHTIMHWNAVAEEKTGIEKDKALHNNLFDVLPGLKKESFLAQLQQALSGTENHFQRAENVYLKNPHNYAILPLKNAAEEVTGVLHTINDVSKQLELQQQLSERLNFIESLVEFSVDRIVVLDRFMNYLYWNKKAEQYYSVRKEKVLGKNILEVFPSFRNNPGYQQFRTVLRGETVYLPPVASEETDEYFETYLIPIKNGSGEVTAVLWIVHDLTERKKTEQEILRLKDEIAQKAEEKYRALFTSIDDGFSIIELIFDDKGKAVDFIYQETNPAFARHVGMDLLGRRRSEAFLEKKDLLLEKYEHLVKTGEPQHFEYCLHTLGDQWFQVTASRIGEEGSNRLGVVFRNITEQKEAEEKIRNFSANLEQQIEERTRELQKQLTLLRYTEYLAQSGTWDYEVATGEFKWSEGMYKIFGLPQQMKVQPEAYLDFAAEEDRSIAKKIVNLLKKKHDPFEEILRIRRNNEVRTIKIKGSVFADENGKAQRVIGVDIDITGIQQAEEKLKESRHWLEQTAKASPDSITVYDVQQKQPVYLNNCLAAWLGLDNEELVALGIEGRLQLVHPDDRLKLLHQNEMTASAKDGEVLTLEYRLNTNNGKTIWVRNRSKVFQRDALGKVTHLLSVLQNVTEEVQLREELKQRTEYAEAIINASIDRIAVYDRQLNIIAWNRRAEIVTGRKKETLIGKKLFEAFPRVGQDEELVKAHQDALQGSYVSLPAKKGVYTNSYYERFYIPLKNERGETYAVVSIMHDISELVRRNEELNELNQSLGHKNEELEQKNEEITNFAFVASHDMKEPLRKIHTFSDWLMDQEINYLSPKGKSLVEKINASVHRMEVLIDDILVLTKIHSDKHKDDDVDLSRVLHRVQDEMQDALRQTQAIIEADQLPVIKGNFNQLFYLFKNLISNAIKFQKPGNVPKLRISADIVEEAAGTKLSAHEEYLKLSFSDNGFGFDQRYAKKIFQVFQRLHGKHEFEGTGIGLAICKKIMENHEGTITVESEQGAGSNFICYFPLQ